MVKIMQGGKVTRHPSRRPAGLGTAREERGGSQRRGSSPRPGRRADALQPDRLGRARGRGSTHELAQGGGGDALGLGGGCGGLRLRQKRLLPPRSPLEGRHRLRLLPGPRRSQHQPDLHARAHIGRHHNSDRVEAASSRQLHIHLHHPCGVQLMMKCRFWAKMRHAALHDPSPYPAV